MNASRIRGIAAVGLLALGISGMTHAQSSPASDQKQKPAAETKSEAGPKSAAEGDVAVMTAAEATTISGNTIGRDVLVAGNASRVTVAGNTITGSLLISGNTGGVVVAGNTTGALVCVADLPPAAGQCNN